MLLAFVETLSAACNATFDQSIRLISSACVHVMDSHFYNLYASTDGGAIQLGHRSEQSIIQTSTFVNCSAYRYGGAIESFGPLEVADCCGTQLAATYGSFLDTDSTALSFNTTVAVSCRASTTGTLWFSKEGASSMERCNFTTCHAMALGSVLRVSSRNATFCASGLTVVNLTGSSGIDTVCSNPPTISDGNFYNNLIDDLYGLLTANDTGMIVTNCIFSGNSREFYLIGNSPSVLFQVSNCVFSGPLGTQASWVALVTANVENSLTASHLIDIPGTCYVLTGSDPPPSPTVSMSPSLCRMYSGTQTAQVSTNKCVIVVDSYFQDLSASDSGGAVRLFSSSATAPSIIQMSSFVRCSAAQYGGAIESFQSLGVSFCCADECSAPDSTYGRGSFIDYVSAETLVMTEMVAVSCDAARSGTLFTWESCAI